MAEVAKWWNKPRDISICVDTPGWFDPFARELADKISALGDNVRLVRKATDVQEGSVAFYLSCTRLTPPEVLGKNRQNIVVHASALPEGRGFSPIVWQVLEGHNRIPITMILAASEPDSGDILLQDEILLTGSELNHEIRAILGAKIQQMCLDYLSRSQPGSGQPQSGTATWYRRRTPEDSQLDPSRTIAEQFDLLRVVDNERYPAFFDYRGRRFIVRVEAAGPADSSSGPKEKKR